MSVAAVTCLDVAIVGVRSCRYQTQGHEHIVFGNEVKDIFDGLAEELVVLDEMVGRGYYNLRFRISEQKRVCGVRYRRCSVSGVWFKQKILFIKFGCVLYLRRVYRTLLTCIVAYFQTKQTKNRKEKFNG